MPELRQDIVSGRWVVIATERAKRPESFSKEVSGEQKSDSICPFCYGNEHLTPPEVMAYRDDPSRDTSGWQVRVVPNKYPAFVFGEKVNNEDSEIYSMLEGAGAHEVIISNPSHHKSFALLTPEEAALVVSAYRDRYLTLKENEQIKSILLIVNHGKTAGASLEHPHSQLFAVPLVPKMIQEELKGSVKHFKETNKCVFCKLIEYELRKGIRIIEETENFVAFAPYASRVPFEVWIIPKNHEPRFETVNEEVIREFAALVQSTLNRLYVGLGDPPYNYYLHTLPCRGIGSKLVDLESVYHWHLEILPKLSIMAGFELGADISINVTRPEDTVQFLRNVSVYDRRSM